MSTRHAKLVYNPTPFPISRGMVLRSRKPPTVMKAKLMQKTWMGEDIVVWCDENGRVCVAEAFCPRLGSTTWS